MSAAAKKKQLRIVEQSHHADRLSFEYEGGAIGLYQDFKGYKGKGEAPHIEERLRPFLEPIFKYVASELGIVIDNTREVHDLYNHFFGFLRSFVLTHGSNEHAPSPVRLKESVKEFIAVKKRNRDDVLQWTIEDKKPKLVLWDAELYSDLYVWSKATWSVDDRIAQLKARGAHLFGCKTGGQGKRIIFSCEHPDIPFEANAIIPMVEQIIAKGIEVEIIKGAFRYPPEEYNGKVNIEISLLCHYQTIEQREYVITWVSPYRQQSFLHIDEQNNLEGIEIKTGEASHYGTWQQIPPCKPEWLDHFQGYSILNGSYFGTQTITEKKKTA